MKKLLALYTQPDDVDAFLAHYHSVHQPLVERIPGLARLVVNRVTGTPMGSAAPYFMIAEMHFSDAATFEAAMRSPENREAGRDLMSFARNLVTLIVVEDDDGLPAGPALGQ